MAIDLDHINSHPTPTGLEVKADNFQPINDTKDLPYAGDNGAVSQLLMEKQPEKARRFIATLNGKVVGHSCVFFSDGPYANGGLYNVGVIPSARNQGIGKAVVSAACRYAKEQGYQYATLNGTGRRMYEEVGFRWIGYGYTWWLMTDKYISNPPSSNEVALIEALGRGDMKEVERLAGYRKDLNTPVTNGMTLMQVAVHCKQYESVQWLSDHGLPVTVLDAWDIGWKDRAEKILADNPQEVNRQYEEGELTLLHQAALRNDASLARMALKAKPDMNIKDKHYQATAYGWAHHFEREEIKQLIKEYLDNN
jgi:predicted N-acetyltransferase YhbS